MFSGAIQPAGRLPPFLRALWGIFPLQLGRFPIVLPFPLTTMEGNKSPNEEGTGPLGSRISASCGALAGSRCIS